MAGHRNWWYSFLISVALAGLWVAGSAFASPRAGRELGLSSAPSFAAPLAAGRAGRDLASPEETPTAVLVAHVTWQGIGQPSHYNLTESITLTLRLNSVGSYIDYAGMTTDASGFFTVSVDSLPVGTYTYRAKGFRNLANSGSVTLAGAPVTSVEIGLMRAGDASNDNVVNSTDFVILKNLFGKAYGEPGYDNRPDFNNSDRVDAPDYNLLRANFGSRGALPIGP